MGLIMGLISAINGILTTTAVGRKGRRCLPTTGLEISVGWCFAYPAYSIITKSFGNGISRD